MTPRGQ